MTAVNSSPGKVQFVEIGSDNDGQRVDNFLLSKLKGVPKSRIYKILRSGEVRVNKGRVKPSTRLVVNDVVRIPPVRMAEQQSQTIPDSLIREIDENILFENNDIIIINKPAGLAVHAGSNIKLGVIDILRADRFKDNFIELAHRLDRQTSGCLVLAKSRQVLTELNKLMTSENAVSKQYLALTQGNWAEGEHRINAPLSKNEIKGGERMVTVNPEGKKAISLFTPSEQFTNCSLVDIKLLTGRTHQIRVHASHEGHPVAGDSKYGDKTFNKQMKEIGLKRMFLHARTLEFDLNGHINVTAPLDANLQKVINNLRINAANNEEKI